MRFSVIVPLYNKAPYVEKALGSILNQTYADYELIVIDDGSTDDSLAVARRVLNGTKAIIISQKNTGVSVARNNGVAASTGDFLCFLDADDWWENDFLEKMSSFIDEFPDAKLYSSNYFYVKNARSSVRVNIQTGYYNYFKEYSQNLNMPAWTGATCISRTVFEELSGFKPFLKLGEDFDLWLRVALTYKTAFLNIPLASYNQDVDIHNRGIGHLQKPEYHILWNIDCFSDEEKNNEDFKRLIDNLRVYSLFSYFISDDYHDAAKEQLIKVDWSRQPNKTCRLYNMPIFVLRYRDLLLKSGSKIKQFLLKYI